MKKIKLFRDRVAKVSTAVLVLFAMLFSGCEDYLDVNDDPDAILDNPGVFLLPSIEISLASAIGGTFALHGSLWAQYYNQNNTANQYRTIIDMDMRSDDGDNMWVELYSSALSDIQKLKEYSMATETYNPRLNLIAVVLESYTFQIVFDAFGQAPYVDAFKGETEANFNPKFDKGEDVYPLLVDAIDEALTLYNEFNPDGTSALSTLVLTERDKDYIFQGDIDAWVAMANSVKLKLAMRNLDFDQTWAMSVINEVEAENNYLTSDAMLDIFEAETNKENPLFAQDQNLNTTINLVADRTLSEFWSNNGDPREPLTYQSNSAGDLLLDHGDHKALTATNPPNSNRIPILDATRPVYLFTTSEVDFFRAELVARGLVTGNAQALYNSAVASAFARVGASATDAMNNFLAAGMPYEFSATQADQLRDIGVQKWAAMANVNPFEGFLEVNRMDYPPIEPTTTYDAAPPAGNAGAKLYLPKNTVLGTDYIRRYLLPESESVANSNFPSAQTLASDKLWWDVN
ncbi:MAG: SusD/RagB family nutrient-binding outer membrane lipoprotein [Bacteroidota bacterium]